MSVCWVTLTKMSFLSLAFQLFWHWLLNSLNFWYLYSTVYTFPFFICVMFKYFFCFYCEAPCGFISSKMDFCHLWKWKRRKNVISCPIFGWICPAWRGEESRWAHLFMSYMWSRTRGAVPQLHAAAAGRLAVKFSLLAFRNM